MFPTMDYEVIECVLRSNNGAVDATIDQLLQMSIDGQASDDSTDSDDSIPPEVSGKCPSSSMHIGIDSILLNCPPFWSGYRPQNDMKRLN